MIRTALPLFVLMIGGCVPETSPPGQLGSPPARRESHRITVPTVATPLPTKLAILTQSRFTILHQALTAAQGEGLLAGPVTVIAPDNDAWGMLAPGIIADLFKPENRGSLVALLRFQLVPARVDIADLRRRAIAGSVRIPTLAGEPITVSLAGSAMVLSDATGHHAVAAAGPAVSDGAIVEVKGLLVPRSLGPQP